MDSNIASNKFVLPRSLEPFKPEPQPLVAEAPPKEAASLKLNDASNPSSAQAQQAAIQQGNTALEKALFQGSGFQTPLFTQLASSNVKTVFGKPTQAEKSEAQQKAFEQSSGEDGEGISTSGLSKPSMPTIRPKPFQNFTYQSYYNQAALTIDGKEQPQR